MSSRRQAIKSGHECGRGFFLRPFHFGLSFGFVPGTDKHLNDLDLSIRVKANAVVFQCLESSIGPAGHGELN